MKLVISNSSQLNEKGAFKNGNLVVPKQTNNTDKFFKQCYLHLNLSYPKYFKMDGLSKLCFLCAEFLTQNYLPFTKYNREQIGIILENYHSSLNADIKHQHSINDRENYFPSPSVFVYTLPNIMVGELCIRHKIMGEGSCFLFPKSNKTFIKNYIYSLFEKENYQCCITGFVDFTDKAFDASLFLIEKSENVANDITKFDTIFK